MIKKLVILEKVITIVSIVNSVIYCITITNNYVENV